MIAFISISNYAHCREKLRDPPAGGGGGGWGWVGGEEKVGSEKHYQIFVLYFFSLEEDL